MKANDQQEPVKRASRKKGIRLFFSRLIDLQEGLDREGTIYTIRNNKNMEGANAWMLMCSIMIASLGLDLGSPAVIIGAMLISPLMSPILGVGLAVGTNDFDTLRISLRHFGVAILIALATSTLYFMITPLGTPTREILSRTEPTALDVLIAAFGGIAGIVSISRRDKSNAIPGVAIATALMPPLCVTGFGIAEGNLAFAIKAFYLFFLNSFFVALATCLLVLYLGFPSLERLDSKGKRNKSLIMVVFSFLVLIPSLLLLHKVYLKVKTENQIEQFLTTSFQERIKFVDDWELVPSDTLNRVLLKVYGTRILPRQDNYRDALEEYGIENTILEIIPTAEIDLAKFQALEAKVSGFEEIRDEKSRQDFLIDSIIQSLTQLKIDTVPMLGISRELQSLYPELEYVAFARAQYSDFQNYEPEKPICILSWKSGTSRTKRAEANEKIEGFLKARTGLNQLTILEE